MAHRKYSDTQRAEATGLILEHGRPAAQVARDMSVSVTTVHRWVSDALTAHGVPAPLASHGSLTNVAATPKVDLESQMREAIRRLGQLESRLEKLTRQATFQDDDAA